MAEPKLSPEVALIAALDTHVHRQGPKRGAEMVDAVSDAVDVILQEKVEPDIVRRAVAFVRDRAQERAKAAQAEYDARRGEKATPPNPSVGPDSTVPTAGAEAGDATSEPIEAAEPTA